MVKIALLSCPGTTFHFMLAGTCNTAEKKSLASTKQFHGMKHQICANLLGAFCPSLEVLEELEEFVALVKLTPYQTVWMKDDYFQNFHQETKLYLDSMHNKRSGDLAQRSITPSPENYQNIFVGLVESPEVKVREIRGNL